MTLNHSYQRELEALILDVLLPVYVKSEKAKGVKDPLAGINSDLLKQVKKAKVLPALLRPKEKWACTDSSNHV
jgi:hypothetical protein